MAQQTVNFEIAAHTKGMESIAKLINEVGTLQKEMKSLQQATANTTSTFNKASQGVKGLTNPLDAQSKALRQQRQGFQQVGMQINDFATSISTGASVTTAFNQQIGQLGYALSLTQGKFGAFGRFLAGPWGAAITIAVMLLGNLAESFFDSSEEAEKAAKQAKEYTQITTAQKLANESLIGVTDELNRLSGRYTETMAQQAQAAMIVAKSKIWEAQQTLQLALAEATLNKQRAEGLKLSLRAQTLAGISDPGARAAAGALGAMAGAAEETYEQSQKTISELEKQVEQAQGALKYLEVNGVKSLENTSNATTKVKSSMDRFLESLSKTEDRLTLAREAFLAGKISTAQYRAEIEKAEKAERQFAQVPIDKINALKGGDKPLELFTGPFDVSPLEQFNNEQKKITESAREIQSAYESIGNAVAQGFKGMITGAQSFGDAMKGIIQAVIDELFRLYVVQQIVGFVKGALNDAFGGGASPSGSSSTLGTGASRAFSRAAVGGYPAPGKPVMVGERGPELFVPTGSGKIIPNHRLSGGGGGMIINVDARGSSDPEAVRQQVQQGILEAAPSIVAAAQNRTIESLRRPRLAGTL